MIKKVLRIIEQHDEAYNAWRIGEREKNWQKAETRLQNLFKLLDNNLRLYTLFYKVDNDVEGKDQECFEWFLERI